MTTNVDGQTEAEAVTLPVLQFPTLEPVTPLVDTSIVELLEHLLAAAKTGEIQAIAGVTMNTAHEFGDFTSSSAHASAIPFLSYIRVLQLKFERKIPTT